MVGVNTEWCGATGHQTSACGRVSEYAEKNTGNGVCTHQLRHRGGRADLRDRQVGFGPCPTTSVGMNGAVVEQGIGIGVLRGSH